MDYIEKLWRDAKPIEELDLDGLARAFEVVEKECWACDTQIPVSRQKASGLCSKCLPEDTMEILSDNSPILASEERGS